MERRTFVQDFFFELMRDSQRVRATQLAERDKWIRGIAVAGREEILFELELLLRGLDRFFNPRNLFADAQPPPDRDYRGELKAARDALHRAVHLARRLTVPTQEQALLFRSFLEGSLADDRARARLGAELREQRTPEESLFLLRTGLLAHQGILDHLLQLERAPQALYLDVGRALQHELFASRYFCPPAALEFRAEYDRVASVVLLDALRDQQDERRRKAFALGLLALFRMLRTLRYVPAAPAVQPRRVLVVLALARSELWALVGYLETDLPRLCASGAEADGVATVGRTAAVALRAGLEQTKAVLLVPATRRDQTDSARDALVTATKIAIGALAQGLDPTLTGPEVFEDQRTRVAQSARLWRDLWVFHQLTLTAAQALSQPDASPSAAEPLRRFAVEFRDVSYQLLRHSDREAFDRFLDLLDGFVDSARGDPARLASPPGQQAEAQVARLRDDCRKFAEILRFALETVDRRRELGRESDAQTTDPDLLAQHLKRG